MTAAPHEPRLASLAALVADASRARMLCFLLDGECASAGELARAASIGPATASAHLARLLDAGLLACQPQGRHRYYRLADGEVAQALQALALVAERGTHTRSWASPARSRLRFARCCYGHLAGQVGVAVLRGMLASGWLERCDERRFAVTANGAVALTKQGLDGAAWQRRSHGAAATTAAGQAGPGVAYGCLDWSERRDHLAGPLARALLARYLERGWLLRVPEARALRLTPGGHTALGCWLSSDTTI